MKFWTIENNSDMLVGFFALISPHKYALEWHMQNEAKLSSLAAASQDTNISAIELL